jgi:hypothetical protein
MSATTQIRSPLPGDYLKPDGWNLGGSILHGDGPSIHWDGCDFRIPSGDGLYRLAVGIRYTGKKLDRDGNLRVQVIFWKEDEEDVVCGGILHFNDIPPEQILAYPRATQFNRPMSWIRDRVMAGWNLLRPEYQATFDRDQFSYQLRGIRSRNNTGMLRWEPDETMHGGVRVRRFQS